MPVLDARTTVGAHEAEVARLREAYAALPPGTPVRLAKRTSNLFRFRDADPKTPKARTLKARTPKARTPKARTPEARADLGLDVSAFGHVLCVDPATRTARVGGMTTYEDLCDATLPHQLMPLVVPQLKTITLGGAVTGLGIESTSLRNGMPHESVTELEILTVGAYSDVAPWRSDYTGQQIYYQSVRRDKEDFLAIRDYLWRWDTDWFWCSRPFGVQKPLVRRLWPRRYRRSDVYRKLVALDRRYGLSSLLDAKRDRPPREAVIQDVEIPVERGAEFLRFFQQKVGMSPVWMCPLRLRGERVWPLYPLRPGEVYVNFGFWGTVPLAAGRADGYHNRLVEDEVTRLDGHKSLYSTSFYAEDDFYRLYNGEAYRALKRAYDGEGRLLGLYEKCVRGR